jgi:hypothetical protein
MGASLEEISRELRDLSKKVDDHILDDAERQGMTMKELAEIKGDLKVSNRALEYLVKAQEAQEDRLEKSGSHNVEQLQKKADFWPKVITTAIIGLLSTGVVALIGYWATHH